MITVFDIVTSPTFKNFQIISGEKGIQNQVTGTGIFDWESKADIGKSFRKGEFVITTLAIAKDDFDFANDCIRALILHGVSAICIKEVFFRNLSEDTIQKSNILGVPIFFFSDTFVDDIVYEVRNMMAADKGELRSNFSPTLKEALISWYRTGSIPRETSGMIEEKLHPYLEDHTRCVLFFPKNGVPMSPTMQPSRNNLGIQSILIPYETGMLALLSSADKEVLADEKLQNLLEVLQLPDSDCWMGASTILLGTRQLDEGILQAFLGCARAMVVGEANPPAQSDDDKADPMPIAAFTPTSVENLLICSCWSGCSRQFYLQKRQILDDFDKEHGSDLLGTLSAYIEANGDLVKASKMLYQHANTVRYRVAKIKSLLDIDMPSSYLELYVFVKLMQIYEAFEKTFRLTI
jgi:PucR family transcriptional regulator, proline-responsive transcriptional activator